MIKHMRQTLTINILRSLSQQQFHPISWNP
jgi:hypothetical protein